ncbi:MAG: hypothetical protein WCS52_16820 [bacterium]
MKTKTACDVSYSGGRASAPVTRKSIIPPLGPQWIGIPSVGHCPITGLSRPHIYNLTHSPAFGLVEALRRVYV